jgi:hypothetical protein
MPSTHLHQEHACMHHIHTHTHTHTHMHIYTHKHTHSYSYQVQREALSWVLRQGEGVSKPTTPTRQASWSAVGPRLPRQTRGRFPMAPRAVGCYRRRCLSLNIRPTNPCRGRTSPLSPINSNQKQKHGGKVNVATRNFCARCSLPLLF